MQNLFYQGFAFRFKKYSFTTIFISFQTFMYVFEVFFVGAIVMFALSKKFAQNPDDSVFRHVLVRITIIPTDKVAAFFYL